MEEKELLEDQMESKEWEIKLCKKNIVSTEEEVRQYEKKLEKGEASRFNGRCSCQCGMVKVMGFIRGVV